MLAFAAAVVFQLLAQVNGLLTRQIRRAGHRGYAVGAVTKRTRGIGFSAAFSHVICKTIQGDQRQYKHKSLHFFLVKKRGLVRDPATEQNTGRSL